MKIPRQTAIAAVVLVAALVAGLLWWLGRGDEAPPPPPSPVARVAPPPAPPARPPILHPLAPPAEEMPLPALDDSDGVLAPLLAQLVGDAAWRKLFLSERIVRRVVATVDNLPRREAPPKTWPLRPVGGWLKTAQTDGQLVIAPDNARRYARYLQLVTRLDMAAVAALYRRHYPLFQQAYVELGYPQGYFNDRLIVALDDLLATPEPDAPVRLVQDKVIYQYADADLESRSAGQRILLRIGTASARQVKAKLRELRTAVAAGPVTDPASQPARRSE